MIEFIWPSDQDRADNDELNRVCEYLEEVLDERDAAIEREMALAANVERLRKASLDAIFYLPGGEIKAELRDAYDDTPETSLTRRDLIKQAEVLELAESAMTNEQDAATMRLNAASLRQRAQEATNAPS